jgi:hypothetical protein
MYRRDKVPAHTGLTIYHLSFVTMLCPHLRTYSGEDTEGKGQGYSISVMELEF